MKSLRSLALSLLVLFTFGCTPIFGGSCIPVTPTCTTPVAFSRSFDFEHCTDALCGFMLVAGNARVVSAFHSGEHALQIDGGGRVIVALNGVSIARGGEDVTMVARCESGGSLMLREGLTVEDNGQATNVSGSVGATPGMEWSAVTATFFALEQSLSATTTLAAANDLSLEVVGGGSCTVDEVIFSAHTQSCPTGFGFDAGSGFDGGSFDTGRRDAPSDVAAEASILFHPCTTNAQCGTGGTCLTTFPGGGVCTRRCTNDRACGSDGVCDPMGMVCLPACSSGGGECDQFGGACAPLDEAFTVGECRPSCYVTGAPAGYPSCVDPIPMCDRYNGVCGTPPGVGAEDGDPCTADSDCAGNHCITELDSTTNDPTGWIGGYCLSYARAGDIRQGQPVPASNCPPGAGVVPIGGEQPGDFAPCFKTCDADSDCRAGYQCDHLTPATGTGTFFSNGICLPVDCSRSGMNCPAGYACVSPTSDAAAGAGVCTLDRDASVPADASADSAIDDASLDVDAME